MDYRSLLGLALLGLVVTPPLGGQQANGCQEGCDPQPDPVVDAGVVDEVKGSLLTERRPALGEKGRDPVAPPEGPRKRPPGEPPQVDPQGRLLKELDHPTPPPQRPDKQPVAGVTPTDPFAEVRIRLEGGQLALEAGHVFDGPLAVSPVVAGSLAYELEANGRVLHVATLPDPRYERVYLPDGTAREAFLAGQPAWFKVVVPPAALAEELLGPAVLRLYQFTGEVPFPVDSLGRRTLGVADLPQLRDRLEPIGATRPGDLFRAVFGRDPQ